MERSEVKASFISNRSDDMPCFLIPNAGVSCLQMNLLALLLECHSYDIHLMTVASLASG
jgi:hypothetical protein